MESDIFEVRDWPGFMPNDVVSHLTGETWEPYAPHELAPVAVVGGPMYPREWDPKPETVTPTITGRMKWDINYHFGTLMRLDNYPRMRRDYQLCWGVLPEFTINQVEEEFFFEKATIDAFSGTLAVTGPTMADYGCTLGLHCQVAPTGIRLRTENWLTVIFRRMDATDEET